MAQDDEFKRTIVYGESAFGYIRKNTLPAYPRYYELWYAYAAGFNHSLNRAVNEIISERGNITVEETQSIYNRYLSPNRLGERIDQVGSRISDEIRDMLDRLAQNSDIVAEYGNSLEGARNQLKHTQSQLQLKALIDNLIKATDDTAIANKALEHQLLESRKQVETLQESLEAIRHESLTDELTTLSNRKHFDQTIERMVQDAAHSGEPLSLLITDIDHFKQFNDNYGHQTGDQVLRLVALAVKQNVKGHDVACRYGGEEFAVLLPHTSLQQAVTVAEHIRRAVISKELVKRSTGENLGRITITIGAATFRPGDTPQTLISRADKALYAGKHDGRNQVKAESLSGTDSDVQVA